MAGARPPVECVICGRSLLVGERPFRFSPDGRGLVTVCPLCKEQAIDLGWVSEGGPTVPVRHAERRRGLLARLLSRTETTDAPVAAPAALRRLSTGEHAIVEAAELFNASMHRRTVEGLTRSLGWPEISIVPLTGVNPEVVITVCWEISWYQYRVSFDSAQPIRLTQRGEDVTEIDPAFRAWNAQLNDAGLIVPELPEA